jgi:hypothetical protein
MPMLEIGLLVFGLMEQRLSKASEYHVMAQVSMVTELVAHMRSSTHMSLHQITIQPRGSQLEVSTGALQDTFTSLFSLLYLPQD